MEKAGTDLIRRFFEVGQKRLRLHAELEELEKTYEELFKGIRHPFFDDDTSYEEYIGMVRVARRIFEGITNPPEVLKLDLGSMITNVGTALENRFFEDPDPDIQELRRWAYGLSHGHPELHCKEVSQA